VAETVPFKYRAFLSYSHRDKAWARWLHRALEGYRIEKDLVGRQTTAGPVPKTLRPIFRDREDFSAGHSLTEQTISALEASQFLIVICSTSASKSQYVNEEIRSFKMLGRPSGVIPIIVDGAAPEHESYPPALRLKPGYGEPGNFEEPIAADARPQGDGKEIAAQKVIAALLGLRLDEIVRRAERARKRRNRFWAAIAGIFLLLTVAASGSAAYAWQQLKINEAFLSALRGPRRARNGSDQLYSMTLSARIRNDSGIVKPSALAVFRLITSSNLVGCSTGMSAGFTPRSSLTHCRAEISR
jgi:hypothetical protein